MGDNPAFEAGDHVTLACNAAGIPYEHHAIVLSVGQEESTGEKHLCVSDFTADGADARIASSGTALGSFGGSGGGIADELEGDGSSDDPIAIDEDGPTKHGLRVLCVAAKEWRKIEYDESAPTSPTEVVRCRVEFLLKHPQFIPSYSLVESNCECVAVWCKTGRWTTLQADNLLGTTNFGSRVAVAGLAVAQLTSAIAVPGVGLLLAAGVATEVASGLWSSHAKRTWEEQTQILNDAFEGSRRVAAEVVDVDADGETDDDNATKSKPMSCLGNPFSDVRSLRDMADAYQRADNLLAMADEYSRQPTSKSTEEMADIIVLED